MSTTRHILSAIVEDKPGVLNRIASMFRRRGFNIESIAVGSSETPGLSRMTIVVSGESAEIEQVRKQLGKIIEVVKIAEISAENSVTRELALIKVKVDSANRGEIMQFANIFRANIIDVTPDSLTMEVTGDKEKLDSLIGLCQTFGILELARTGCVALARGK